MKKSFASLMLAAGLLVPSAAVVTTSCTGWAHAAPKPLEKTAMEAEIRKNWAGDNITGLSLTIDDNGVVTVSGHLATTAERDTAIHDAAKVKDVTKVINNITVP